MKTSPVKEFFDLDIERAVLNTILFTQDAIGDIFDLINGNDFFLPAHKNIFNAVISCLNNDEPTEVGFVKKYLKDKASNDALSEIALVSGVINVQKYANELRELSIRRNLVGIAYKIPAKVDSPDPSKDIIDQVSSEIYKLIEDGGGSMKHSRDIIRETLDEIEKNRLLANKELIGLDTGFKKLNRMTKGFKDGELIIIAARPGMGKTSFVLNLIDKVLKQDKGVILFSLEMPATQIMFRLLSLMTSISSQSIATADFDNDKMSSMSDACSEVSNKSFFVYDSGNVNIHQVKNQVKKLKKSNPEIALCVIDYIGLMTNSSSYNERHLQIADISRNLKLLAREVEMPIIALSQLNRSLESRANKRPMLSDLRESGAIEQDADTILFVYRDEFYQEQEAKEREKQAALTGKAIDESSKFRAGKTEEKAEIIVGKNRHGPTGFVEVVFQKDYSRFVDADPSVEMTQFGE